MPQEIDLVGRALDLRYPRHIDTEIRVSQPNGFATRVAINAMQGAILNTHDAEAISLAPAIMNVRG